MSDGFSLYDAVSGQGQNSNNPWGSQNPGQPGFPGQQYPGYPGPGQGQQNPGYPGPGQGQQNPGYPGSGPAQGQQYPGYPGPAQGQGQQYPGYPGPAQGQGQQYPGYPAAGQQYPGYPGPGQPFAAGATTSPTAPIVAPGPKAVPCALPLPSGCTQGMMLTIQGVPTGNRFSIDYVEGNDVAFHINPRFDEKPYVVVRNSMIQGKWGQEERQCPKFPFQMQQPFKLQILFEPDGYKVSVNNETICKYPHRLKNFAGIRTIRINGAVTINDASVTMV